MIDSGADVFLRGLDLILHLPRNAIQEPQRARLKRLADHFLAKDCTAAPDGSEDELAARGPGRPPKTSAIRTDESGARSASWRS